MQGPLSSLSFQALACLHPADEAWKGPCGLDKFSEDFSGETGETF